MEANTNIATPVSYTDLTKSHTETLDRFSDVHNQSGLDGKVELVETSVSAAAEDRVNARVQTLDIKHAQKREVVVNTVTGAGRLRRSDSQSGRVKKLDQPTTTSTLQGVKNPVRYPGSVTQSSASPRWRVASPVRRPATPRSKAVAAFYTTSSSLTSHPRHPEMAHVSYGPGRSTACHWEHEDYKHGLLMEWLDRT